MLGEDREGIGGLAPIILALIIIIFLFFVSGCGGVFGGFRHWLGLERLLPAAAVD